MRPEPVLAILAAVALTAIVAWPVTWDLSGRVIGIPGDSQATIWSIWHDHHGGDFSLWGMRGGGLVGAPLGFTESALPGLTTAVVAVPAYVVSPLVGEVAAYNLAVLSGLALSGLAMYWLVRFLGGSPWAAGLAGAAFALFPWHLGRALGAPSQTHLEGLPLLALALLAWRARPGWRRAALVAPALFLCLVSDPYIALMGCVLGGVVAVVVLADRLREAGGRKGALGALQLAAAGAVALIPVGLAWRATDGAAAAGVSRNVLDLITFGARADEFFRPLPDNPILGGLVGAATPDRLHGSNEGEIVLYLGFTVMILAAAFLVTAFTRRRPGDRLVAVVGTALVVAGLWFALAPPVRLLGVGIPSPSEALLDVAAYWRVSARFVAMMMLGLLVLAALGLDRLRALVPAGWPRAAVVGVAFVALAVEFAAWPVLRSFPAGSPGPEIQVLGGLPDDTVVADYPLLGRGHPATSEYLYRQRWHGARLLNGAAPGTAPDRLRNNLLDPSAPGAAAALAAAGVTVVVVHEDGPAGLFTQPAADTPGLRRVMVRGGAGVYRVTAAPAPAQVEFMTGFSEGMHEPGATFRYLAYGQADLLLHPTRPGPVTVEMDVSSVRGPRAFRLIDGLTDDDLWSDPELTEEVRRVRVKVDLGSEPRTLILLAEPGPEVLATGGGGSVRVANVRVS